jgi:hypothetical protein
MIAKVEWLLVRAAARSGSAAGIQTARNRSDRARFAGNPARSIAGTKGRLCGSGEE